jgi:hypothetical protein
VTTSTPGCGGAAAGGGGIGCTDAGGATGLTVVTSRSLESITVVTADRGQSDPRDQRSWKRLSSDFSQVVLSGGHDIYLDSPQGVIEQILNTVDRNA